MKIPGDQGYPWRLDKFVEYQHFAPAVDPITYVEYAERSNLAMDDCILLAWYHSLTYCEITAAFLFENMDPTEPEKFWKENKDKLIFGSARKYVKNMDWFVPLMKQFVEATGVGPLYWLLQVANPKASPKQRLKNIEKYLGKWKFMGRFSIDLFTEALIAMHNAGLIPLKLEYEGYDWRKTSNLTSGLFNIFYQDNAANKFDETGMLTKAQENALDHHLAQTLQAVHDKYPDQEISDVSVVNKICSFRNLFKNARYGGFHHDRQLGNLYHYLQVYPKNDLWERFFDIRQTVFPIHMLGECGGDTGTCWHGIRKERKKLWTTEGMTGVESSS